jgi:hypothetical protein
MTDSDPESDSTTDESDPLNQPVLVVQDTNHLTESEPSTSLLVENILLTVKRSRVSDSMHILFGDVLEPISKYCQQFRTNMPRSIDSVNFEQVAIETGADSNFEPTTTGIVPVTVDMIDHAVQQSAWIAAGHVSREVPNCPTLQCVSQAYTLNRKQHLAFVSIGTALLQSLRFDIAPQDTKQNNNC